MEKKSLKDQYGVVASSSSNTSRGIIRDCNYNHHNDRMVTDSWYGEDNRLSRFSWPPRSYTCSFCKREFRSAQALGGHMNVHRRDRARLRQYSPPTPRDVVHHGHGQCPKLLNLDLSPKCANPNFTTSSSSSTSLAFPPISSYALPSLVSPSSTSIGEKKIWDHDHLNPKSADLGRKMKSARPFFGDVDQEFKGFTSGDECKILEKAEIVRLDLEIGLISESKEDLDLELRLGY